MLPLLSRIAVSLGQWLGESFGENLRLAPDLDEIPALSAEREAVWARIGVVFAAHHYELPGGGEAAKLAPRYTRREGAMRKAIRAPARRRRSTALCLAAMLFASAPDFAVAQNMEKLRGTWLSETETRYESRATLLSVLSSFGECATFLHSVFTDEDDVTSQLAGGFAGKCTLSADGQTLSVKYKTGDLMRCKVSQSGDRLTLSGCRTGGKDSTMNGNYVRVRAR